MGPLPHHAPLKPHRRGALRRAQEAFFASLDPLTVNDLVATPTGPVLLSLSGSAPGGAD